MDTTNPAARLAGKYLSFRLGNERYAVGVLRVREIIRPTALTATPGMPAHCLGVINLRGRIIPVTDLRRRFGLGEADTQEKACIIVTELNLADGTLLAMGLFVDAVEEVLQVSADEIQQPPRFGGGLETEHLLGMALTRGQVTSLLDLDRLLVASDLSALSVLANGDS